MGMNAIPLSVINDEISQEMATAIEFAVAFELDGIEIRSLDGVPPHLLSLDICHQTQDLLTARNLNIPCFASSNFKCVIPHDVKEEDDLLLQFEWSLEQCEALGAPLMRCFTFYRPHQDIVEVQRSVDIISKLLDRSSLLERSVAVVFENGTRTNTPTGLILKDFLEALDRSDCFALWDPGNSYMSGYDNDLTFFENFTAIFQKIRHIHLKDPSAGKYVKIGSGELPWNLLLQSLRENSYEGYLSLETHWRKDSVLSNEKRDEPFGFDFSSGGYEASAECMTVLRKLLL